MKFNIASIIVVIAIILIITGIGLGIFFIVKKNKDGFEGLFTMKCPEDDCKAHGLKYPCGNCPNNARWLH